MISVQPDKQCCHCEKEHLPCAMFMVEHLPCAMFMVAPAAAYICCQCLSDAVSAVVAAQMDRYRTDEANKRFGQPHHGYDTQVSDGKADDNGNNT